MATILDLVTSAASSAAPASARRRVVVFGASLAFLSFLDRAAISQAGPAISRELHLSTVQMGSYSLRSASRMRPARSRAAGCATASAHGGC